jgi:hypothetical protein
MEAQIRLVMMLRGGLFGIEGGIAFEIGVSSQRCTISIFAMENQCVHI